jgi:prevent-host-death family protein
MKVNIGQAKSQLSELVARALEGEEIILTRDGKSAVRLVPVSARPDLESIIGCLAGSVTFAPDFRDEEPAEPYPTTELWDMNGADLL